MSRRIHVRVIDRKDRKYLVLRWRDPKTGKHREEATDTTRRREAERLAGDCEKRLANAKEHDQTSWATFRERYEAEKLPGVKPSTRAAWCKAARAYQRHMAPRQLADVTEGTVSKYTAKLFAERLSVSSVATYLRTLRVGLNWAGRIFPGYTPPHIEIPKVPRSKMMKGRPITTEEFERMLSKVAAIVGARQAGSWRFLLRGLFLSGLRLGEALSLHWTDHEELHIYRLDNRRPMLRIHAAKEKGGRDRLLPITPDFAHLLRNVPDYNRVGWVFQPLGKRGQPLTVLADVSKIIIQIGEAAAVKVATRVKRRTVDGETTLEDVPKYAGAHDLRRAFGERWAGKVMPFELQELMRHESIETTSKYYVGRNALRTADAVWAAHEGGDTFGDAPQQGAGQSESQEDANPNCQRTSGTGPKLGN